MQQIKRDREGKLLSSTELQRHEKNMFRMRVTEWIFGRTEVFSEGKGKNNSGAKPPPGKAAGNSLWCSL